MTPERDDRRSWSRIEVEATVSDYFHMLKLHLAGQTYSKTAHRRALAERLDRRSEAAIENKHRNISAILRNANHFWIPGYKPLTHFQGLLEEVVLEVAFQDKTLDFAALQAAETPATAPLIEDLSTVLVAPPLREPRASEPTDRYRSNRVGIKRDYIQREALNRSLGLAGEEFVIQYERFRLDRKGLSKLANGVEHASQSRGDGLGYDVMSFDDSGRPMFIEVKTTAFAMETPFYLSRNEYDFSKEQSESFCLYRVFDFRKRPRLFALRGSVDGHCHLDTATFLARFS
jgi:hypothetical protein